MLQVGRAGVASHADGRTCHAWPTVHVQMTAGQRKLGQTNKQDMSIWQMSYRSLVSSKFSEGPGKIEKV